MTSFHDFSSVRSRHLIEMYINSLSILNMNKLWIASPELRYKISKKLCVSGQSGMSSVQLWDSNG
jgi:hypothetical protein